MDVSEQHERHQSPTRNPKRPAPTGLEWLAGRLEWERVLARLHARRG